MIAHFIRLEWKQYFRSSYWQTGIALKIIMGFFALMMLTYLLLLGTFSFKIIEELFPKEDPFQLVNSYLLYAIAMDLIFRYLMQKLPIMNIKPMLVLPIKKSKLVHFVLSKSAMTFYNIMPLFFYIPFTVQLIRKGYDTNGALGWFLAMFLIVQSINFINFLINKNNLAFWSAVLVVGGLALLQRFEIFDVTIYSKQIFQTIYDQPILSLIGIPLLIVFYYLNFKQLVNRVYLDDVVSAKTKEANSKDLSWANRFGNVAPFLKNDIRLIWRNKRPKTVFLMSFFFVAYALIFFTQEVYEEKMPAFLVFASVFTTGGFALNFGQFIPAWDSSYYKMLMSQNIKYRLFLESKWYLMVVMTAVLYILSVPYIYFGIDKFLMITAGAIFNIGFNSLFLLYAGSFNRKRIDLEKSAFANYQGTSATQFIIILPILGLPMLLFWVFSSLISFNAGIIAIAAVGIITIIFKNYFMGLIEAKYIQDKYAAIHAFGKKS
ncbi:DUF5687 family protein [Pseudotenacibaculum sp. MALMAid0570]|uniref:DUF5687 family protein n=1 Tax=Pseudotenacibaculum sp. MALMAid0570 TaxID=3143938 RepID=UPI0032DE4314